MNLAVAHAVSRYIHASAERQGSELDAREANPAAAVLRRFLLPQETL
jgi:hypothetical protein